MLAVVSSRLAASIYNRLSRFVIRNTTERQVPMVRREIDLGNCLLDRIRYPVRSCFKCTFRPIIIKLSTGVSISRVTFAGITYWTVLYSS